MVLTLLMYVVILSMLFGGLCFICGEQRKGSQILVNSITAVVLYMMIAQLACSGLPAGNSFAYGLPFINHIQQAGGIKFLLRGTPGIFARDFVELVTLILLIQWTASLVSFSDAGIAGKITASIIIVFIGIISYGFVMMSIKDTTVLKWCVYCVECLITGGSILYTPAMIISYVLGLKKDNYVITYFMSVLPKTKLGRAISSAITSAMVFIAFALTLESQYGSICNVLAGGIEILKCYGSVIVMLMHRNCGHSIALRLHIQKNAEAAGFAHLSSVSKSTVQQILEKADIKPFKIRYYHEKQDPDFKSKINQNKSWLTVFTNILKK